MHTSPRLFFPILAFLSWTSVSVHNLSHFLLFSFSLSHLFTPHFSESLILCHAFSPQLLQHPHSLLPLLLLLHPSPPTMCAFLHLPHSSHICSHVSCPLSPYIFFCLPASTSLPSVPQFSPLSTYLLPNSFLNIHILLLYYHLVSPVVLRLPYLFPFSSLCNLSSLLINSSSFRLPSSLNLSISSFL